MEGQQGIYGEAVGVSASVVKTATALRQQSIGVAWRRLERSLIFVVSPTDTEKGKVHNVRRREGWALSAKQNGGAL